ncbi:double-CXXCG motif protein [Myxococcus sp. K15C18031901]|uniref:SitI6 family double-CXXCG motif immunity protein n=1 Tax=Myxococcus dinghuensis TaxID=2906761 RepID=UPI0020A78FC6|nr:double-CXXCG motif protein [Myxococcus dinghuensis]MCP3098263.1 double-CXXCG motif protein [Myxococcus dinghuensis]
MRRVFWLREDRAVANGYGGEVHGSHQWGLPGASCPTCGVTWSGAGHYFPSVDLTRLSEHRAFEKARPEPFPEFARLRELVHPLVPSNAELPPGTGFGPLTGTGFGKLPSFAWIIDVLLIQQEAWTALQSEDLQGLQACPTALRFRQKTPPALLEFQIPPRGRLHPDCVPLDVPPPCPTCGRHAFKRPDDPFLDATALPTDLDLFRVGNFATMVIGTERFMDAVQRLKLDGITFRELPAR